MLIRFLYSSILVHCYLLWCVTSILHWCLWNCCVCVVTVCLTFILHSVLAFRNCCTHTFAICRNVCHINPWPSVHVHLCEWAFKKKNLQHKYCVYNTNNLIQLLEETWARARPGLYLFLCFGMVTSAMLLWEYWASGKQTVVESAWPTAVDSKVLSLSWGVQQTERMQTWMGSLFGLFFLRLFPLSLLGIPGNSKHVSVELDWENATT